MNKVMLRTTKLTESTDICDTMVIHSNKGKWQVVILVNTLKTTKIRSNLHTSQSAGGVPSDNSQGQALGEPLSYPGLAKACQQVSCEAA